MIRVSGPKALRGGDVAALLGITARRVLQLATAGEIDSARSGDRGHFRYTPAAVEAYLNRAPSHVRKRALSVNPVPESADQPDPVDGDDFAPVALPPFRPIPGLGSDEDW